MGARPSDTCSVHLPDGGAARDRRRIERDLRHEEDRVGLRRMRRQRVTYVDLAVPSPFALPLMVERFREKLSTEKLKDRLERMLQEMEKEAAAQDQGR